MWPRFYLYGLSLYLTNSLGARNCHGQAGELEKKRPQHQHLGRQGGRQHQHVSGQGGHSSSI